MTLVLVSLFAAAAFAACPCGTLSSPNSVCTLTGNLAAAGSCFTVAANNVTINCNGYTISGPSSSLYYYGIYTTKNYTSVQNCRINGFGQAVFFDKASYGTIKNTSANTSAMTTVDPKGNAIAFSAGSNYNSVVDVTAQSKYGFGIFMDAGGNHNTVENVNLPLSYSAYSMSIRANHTLVSHANASGWSQIAGTYNTLANSTLASLELSNYNGVSKQYNLVYGNTIYGDNMGSPALSIYSTANTIYWNSISNPNGLYVEDNMPAGSNYLNTTINGKPEGNIWGNVLSGSVVVKGNVSSGYPGMALYIGKSGSGYPYNAAHSLGKISGNAVDAAPLTPFRG